MNEAELTDRINQAKANIGKARQLLVEAGGIAASSKILNAKGVLELIEGGVSKTSLEARLIASGWYDVHGHHGGNQRVIWTNPSPHNESVRIMTDEHGSAYARAYNGPTGGGRWGGEQNTKGKWVNPLVPGEQPLVLDPNTGNAIPGSKDATHPPLLPDPPKIPVRGSAVRDVLRGAGKALVPIGLALDAYFLYEAYEADGGKIGENVQSTAGGTVGAWGGAAAGAAIGSLIFPGVGTVIGGVVGGIAGGFGGEALVDLF